MHGAIGLDGEEVGDLDRADLGDAAEIVAKQIDDHQILGALLLVHGEPGLEAGVLARRAPARRRALHRPARQMCLPSRRKNSSGESESTSKIAGADQRAILHALLAPERRIERDRIAREGEAIFQREVDLIDVARGDVVLHLGEGVVVAPRASRKAARPEMVERSSRAVGLEPGPGLGIVERTGARKSPIQKSGTLPIAGQQALAASARGNSRARRRRSPRRGARAPSRL